MPPSPKIMLQSFTAGEAPEAFAKALALRMAVFVEEQQVPEDEEHDEYDETAMHWLMTNAETGEAIATGRMIAYQEACQTPPVAKIGRIAVHRAHRGNGTGKALMKEILADVYKQGYFQAILDSQTPVIPFYEKLGFVIEGDEFMDAGIPHYRMRRVFD